MAYNPNNANGQATNANSAPVTLSTEQQAQLEAIKASVQLLDNAIAGSEMQVDVVTMPAVTVTGVATETTQAAGNVLTGAVTETAPASDTASSGLNGRLQRIAQRLTSILTTQTDGTQKTKVFDKNGDGMIVNSANEGLKVEIVDSGGAGIYDLASQTTAAAILARTTIDQDLRNDSTDMTVTGLASLASSATIGWQSDRVDISIELDVLVSIKLDMANTAPANDKSVYVYLCSWFYDGTTWYGSSLGTATLPTGTNGTCALASAAPNNLKLLGTLAYSTADMVLQDSFLLSNVFGTAMPDAWSIVVLNYSGASTHSSGHKLMYKKLNTQTA